MANEREQLELDKLRIEVEALEAVKKLETQKLEFEVDHLRRPVYLKFSTWLSALGYILAVATTVVQCEYQKIASAKEELRLEQLKKDNGQLANETSSLTKQKEALRQQNDKLKREQEELAKRTEKNRQQLAESVELLKSSEVSTKTDTAKKEVFIENFETEEMETLIPQLFAPTHIERTEAMVRLKKLPLDARMIDRIHRFVAGPEVKKSPQPEGLINVASLLALISNEVLLEQESKVVEVLRVAKENGPRTRDVAGDLLVRMKVAKESGATR